MKLVFSFFGIALLLFSCSSSPAETAVQSAHVDSSLALAIDTTSAHAFIESICNYRKKNETQSGFEITGTCISDSTKDFKVFNFIETYDEYNLNTKYAIVLNPFEPANTIQSGKELFSQITSLLDESKISYSIFQGNFEPSIDFQMDESPDYLLIDESMFRDQYRSTKQVFLFDGVNAIFPTMVLESNEYSETEESVSGIRETMEIEVKKNKYPVIRLHHESNLTFENETGGIDETPLIYDFTWQWTPTKSEWEPGEWITGLTCNYDASNSIISGLTQKRTLLSATNGSYSVMENCQQGEAGFFKLTLFNDNHSSHFVISDHEDDVSVMAVMHAIQLNSSTVILFVSTIEKLGPNLDGNRLLSPPSILTITKKTIESGDEIEIHEFDIYSNELLYTLHPELYPFIECNPSN